MIAIDFTYESGKATGTPLPGFQQGRWWAWGTNRLNPDTYARAAADLARECAIDVAPPQQLRWTVLDMENQGIVNGVPDHAQRERIVDGFLSEWVKITTAKLPVIEFWMGRIPAWPMQRECAALLNPSSNPDKRKLYAMAHKHEPMVRKSGMVVQVGVVHTPEQIDFFCDWIRAMSLFMREMYPGVMAGIWLAGGYTNVPGYPPLIPEHRERICDAAWAGFDFLCLYGEARHGAELGAEISRRLA